MRLIEKNLKNFCLVLVVAFCAVVGCDSPQSASISDGIGFKTKIKNKDDFDAVLARAKKGDTKAMNLIGEVYDPGYDWVYESMSIVPANAAESAKWYRKSAELGDVDGQYGLACLEENLEERIKLLRIPAKRGFGKAQYTLGVAYQKGFGVPKDLIEAFAWLSAAIANGESSFSEESKKQIELSFSPEELIAAQKRAAELLSKYPAKD